MPVDTQRWQGSIADAAATVAGKVLGAIRSAGNVELAAYVNTGTDTTIVLGAIRLVGVDVLSPYLLSGRAVDPSDAAVVARSLAVFPPSDRATTHPQAVIAWRDWATVKQLSHAGLEMAAPEEPDPLTVDGLLGSSEVWPQWSAHAAQLSPLALPNVGGRVTDAVSQGPLALARGITRAMLRKDFVTAGRLLRWSALLSSSGIAQPVDPVLLLEHIRLFSGNDLRLSLDLAIIGRLLGMEPT